MQKQEKHIVKKGFDLRTHIRDAKGNIVKEQPYRLHINGEKREYERPPGSGWFYTEGGDLLRSPKEAKQAPEAPVEEISKEQLLAELKALRAQLGAKQIPGDVPVGSAAEATVEELPEIHMTVDDIKVDDIPQVAEPVKEEKKSSFWNKGK